MVAFFEGESWGYLGSKRFVDDILHFQCNSFGSDNSCSNPVRYSLEFQNIKIDNIVAIIEVNQVANLFQANAEKATVYVHRELGGGDSLLKQLNNASVVSDDTLRCSVRSRQVVIHLMSSYAHSLPILLYCAGTEYLSEAGLQFEPWCAPLFPHVVSRAEFVPERCCARRALRPVH